MDRKGVRSGSQGSFEWPQGDARSLLIFDGYCGICTRLADWVHRHDKYLRVLLLPSQTRELLHAIGLTKTEVDREAWAIDRNGRGYGGAAAVKRTLCEIGGRWELAAHAYRLTGMRQIEDAGYS